MLCFPLRESRIGGILSPDDRLKELVDDLGKGYLTRRGFLAKAAALGLTAAAAASLLGAPRAQKTAVAQDSPKVEPKKWEKGKGWGWFGETTTSSVTSTSSAPS
jgi:hypothetical protein